MRQPSHTVLATARFAGLLRAIEPSSAEHAAGVAASDRLRAHVAGVRSLVASTRLIGAWDKGTSVRPLRDIDMLVVVPPTLEAPETAGGNRPLELLHDVKEAILPIAPDAHLRRDGQAIVVPFAEASVEVSVGFLRRGGRYDVCDAGSGGRYRWLAPDAERAALDTSDRHTRGGTRALIKFFRSWQTYRAVPISSFAIELAILSFLERWEHAADGTRYYDWMVRDAFAFLVDRAGTDMALPGSSERYPLGQAWVSLARVAHQHAARACEAETLGRDRDAWWEWSQIFGDVVPMESAGS